MILYVTWVAPTILYSWLAKLYIIVGPLGNKDLITLA